MNSQNKINVSDEFLSAYKRKLQKLKDYLGYGEVETPMPEGAKLSYSQLTETEKLKYDIYQLKRDLLDIKILEEHFGGEELNKLLTFDLDYSSYKAVRRPPPL
jgi:hypothetical protein